MFYNQKKAYFVLKDKKITIQKKTLKTFIKFKLLIIHATIRNRIILKPSNAGKYIVENYRELCKVLEGLKENYISISLYSQKQSIRQISKETLQRYPHDSILIKKSLFRNNSCSFIFMYFSNRRMDFINDRIIYFLLSSRLIEQVFYFKHRRHEKFIFEVSNKCAKILLKNSFIQDEEKIKKIMPIKEWIELPPLLQEYLSRD
ncbi:MAG: hypothetical protein ACOCV1_03055 [Bacillota bacterium]